MGKDGIIVGLFKSKVWVRHWQGLERWSWVWLQALLRLCWCNCLFGEVPWSVAAGLVKASGSNCELNYGARV